MYFHFHMAEQGFEPLSALFKRIAIREMAHLEQLAERILFLKGDVEMVAEGVVEKIVDPEAALAKAMAMELDTAWAYNKAALECGAKADAGSKQLFERLVADEEAHFAEFEKQRENIKRFGLSYLALQSFDPHPAAAG
jgi:bacterioferritin